MSKHNRKKVEVASNCTSDFHFCLSRIRCVFDDNNEFILFISS